MYTCTEIVLYELYEYFTSYMIWCYTNSNIQKIQILYFYTVHILLLDFFDYTI